MATIRLRDGVELGDYQAPYVVAEVNSSHNGDMATAKAMIDAAAEAGCQCVKFQSWSAQTLYSRTYYDANPITKRIVAKFAFGEAQLKEAAAHCASRGVAFCSTPYSREEVDFLLDECGAPFIKVASMELNNLPYLEYIARKGAPMALSTGMGDMEEIRRAVAAIEATGNRNLCLLHCISLYPAESETIRLLNIPGLREAFPAYPVGFSDHSRGTEMAAAAVALGAALIEKHLTLDRAKIGMDNQMASEPGEVALLVRQCRNVHAALGSRERVVRPAELEQRAKMRRSVIFTRDLPAGSVLALADLDAKRPGTGIPPERMEELAGRTLARDVLADTLLREEDLA